MGTIGGFVKSKRIVSLVPSITEMLYFLGLEDLVAGVTEHCDFPGEAKVKEKVGTFGQPQVSKILGIRPDIVLADGAVHRKLAEELKNAGVEVLAPVISSVNHIFLFMGEIGRVCGAGEAVQPAVDSLRERVRKIGQKPRSIRPRVFRLMSKDPFITPGPLSFQYDALRLAGAQLMELSPDAYYTEVLFDQIRQFNPQVILFCGVEKGQAPPQRCKGCLAVKPICQRTVDDVINSEWDQITAVRENRVYPIPCSMLCRPGPRLIDGIEELHSRYFHQLFN